MEQNVAIEHQQSSFYLSSQGIEKFRPGLRLTNRLFNSPVETSLNTPGFDVTSRVAIAVNKGGANDI